MTFGLDDYGLRVLGIFMLFVPSALYVMGLMEGRRGGEPSRGASSPGQDVLGDP